MPNSQEFGFDFFPLFMWGLSFSLSSPPSPFFPTVLEKALESQEYLKAFLLLTAIND